MRLYCHQAWVVGQTASLADSRYGGDNVSLSVDNLRELLKSRTGYHTALLSKRVRNTALIGNSVPADVREQYGGYGSADAVTATVIPVASTNTLPGYRPAAVITDMGDGDDGGISNPKYPAMISALKKGLSLLGLSELPQDCVVLCGARISPEEVGQHLASAGLGQAQVYHAGVITFHRNGKPKKKLSMWDDEEQV